VTWTIGKGVLFLALAIRRRKRHWWQWENNLKKKETETWKNNPFGSKLTNTAQSSFLWEFKHMTIDWTFN